MVSLAVSVEELYGDIRLKRDARTPQLDLRPTRDFVESDAFLEHLKLYRLDSKNYCNMFLTKTKVMTAIIIDLLKRLDLQTKALAEELEAAVGLALASPEASAPASGETAGQVAYLKDELAALRTEAYQARLELSQRQKSLGEASGSSPLTKELELQTLALRSAFSKLVRSLATRPKALSHFTAVESNPQLLEFYLLQLFEHARRCLGEHLGKLLELQTKVNVRLGSVRTALLELLRLQGRPREAVQTPDLSLSGLLDRSYARFIRAKVSLAPDVRLEDAHIAEYFQDPRQLTYFSSSYLVRKHFRATCVPKDLKPVPCLVVFDVAPTHQCVGNINAFTFDPASLDRPAERFERQAWVSDNVIFSNHMANLSAALLADANEADKKTVMFSFQMPESHQERRFVFRLETEAVEVASGIVTSVNKKYL